MGGSTARRAPGCAPWRPALPTRRPCRPVPASVGETCAARVPGQACSPHLAAAAQRPKGSAAPWLAGCRARAAGVRRRAAGRRQRQWRRIPPARARGRCSPVPGSPGRTGQEWCAHRGRRLVVHCMRARRAFATAYVCARALSYAARHERRGFCTACVMQRRRPREDTRPKHMPGLRRWEQPQALASRLLPSSGAPPGRPWPPPPGSLPACCGSPARPLPLCPDGGRPEARRRRQHPGSPAASTPCAWRPCHMPSRLLF